ncbi:MAG: flagellar M-ring protein FliF [Clostridia bacterium]|nr:flagellar M-ring protein FliF [Clostridia bacterium]
MAEFLQRIRTQLNSLYQSLDKRKKIWLGVGALFVVFVIVGILFLTRPKYVTLISDIDYAEMADVTAKLEELNIGYKEDPNSTIIMVDIGDLTKAKMAIAKDLNLSAPDYTWTDVFANTSFTMTSEVKAQQIMQAKASTLSQAIETYIEGVESAIVDLYIAPDTSFLLDETDESRVSILLVLENGFAFSEREVDGIVQFVMNAVQNLPKENITIVDQTGQTLNRFSDSSDAFIASTNYEQTKTVENQLEDKLNAFLGAIYGRTHVKVMTAVKLDFDDYSSQSTKFAPPVEGSTEGLVRSMTELSESAKGSDTASGVAGTDSNITTTTYPTGTDSTSTLEKASKTVNFELNEIVEVLNKAKGTIEDITVSIIIDTAALVDETLTEEHKKEVVDLVTGAAGLETRNVTVVAAKFSDDPMGLQRYNSEDANVSPGIPLWVLGGIVGVLLVGVIVFFVISRKKSIRAKEAEIAAIQAAEEEKRISELEEIRTDIEDKSSPKYQIEKFIDAKPEAVAALLRSWMSDI